MSASALSIQFLLGLAVVVVEVGKADRRDEDGEEKADHHGDELGDQHHERGQDEHVLAQDVIDSCFVDES